MRDRVLIAWVLLAAAGCDDRRAAESPTPAPSAALPPVAARTPIPPEELFNKHGCPACHAKGAKHEDKLVRAAGKPVEEVAEWIRNPQAKKPGTGMPTFAAVIDETEARALAEWVQARVAAQGIDSR